MNRIALLAAMLAPTTASADQCRVLDVDFTTADDGDNAMAPYHFRPQVVVWLEDGQGHYVDTLYITQETGTYGLGNRPGEFDFNSGPLWPYGRRQTIFPVWSHVEKATQLADMGYAYPFPAVVFQDGNDAGLSHQVMQSSNELHFCQPLTTTDPRWSLTLDAASCASTMTDKGKMSTTMTTGYPPRVDVMRRAGIDSADVDQYPNMNPFDAVSTATPQNGALADVFWPLPKDLADGNYVVVVEVAKEFDYNATYNADSYPAPHVAYGNYGVPYRGQPSVVYRVPIAVSGAGTDSNVQLTDTYAGYGDPDGMDGAIRAADNTISTGVPGSGGGRLQLVSDAAGMYRVKVTAATEPDNGPPGIAEQVEATTIEPTTATLRFVAPGADGDVGTVRRYDIRYRAAEEITDGNFATSIPVRSPTPDEPGAIQTVKIEGLLPQTDYYIGIRALDDCRNQSPLAVIKLTTPRNLTGEVDACFVATAAYGSAMATEVSMLRRFRDQALRHTVLGELFVETYYTFGPALAGVVGESDLLRATAREALGPLVRFAGKQ